jgi:hypothetical protein
MPKGSDLKRPVRAVRPSRPPPVLVCRKCLKRSDEGGDIKRALKDEAKQTARLNGTKPARVVMTGCFGLCPKRAVVTATADSLSRGEFLLIDTRRS